MQDIRIDLLKNIVSIILGYDQIVGRRDEFVTKFFPPIWSQDVTGPFGNVLISTHFIFIVANSILMAISE